MTQSLQHYVFMYISYSVKLFFHNYIKKKLRCISIHRHDSRVSRYINVVPGAEMAGEEGGAWLQYGIVRD